jgi:anti-sigma factor RsiW
MLSRQELELLTAHVDGELTARQRRQLNRLLKTWPPVG